MASVAMLAQSLPSAGDTPRGPSVVLLVVLALFFLVLIGLGVVLVARLLRKSRPAERPSQAGPNQVTRRRLLSIWQRFLEPLPPSVRVALFDYDHFLVFGDPGVGKSALVSRRVDWQSQASQFLPSHTADPLLQLYLGSRTVVQEISSTLLQSASREAHDGFRKLWKTSLPSAQIPTVVIVLKVSVLSTASPDVLRQQAKLIRGKINLLTEQYGAPIPTRLCLTNMERVSGYSEFARFLHKNKLPLILDASGDAQSTLGMALQGYEKHLPRALTTMPVGPFEASIEILHSAEELMTPVRAFIAALIEGSVASVRPDVQGVYFFSLAPDEEVGNPFDPVLSKAARAPSWFARFLRWLLGLGIRPLHALLSLLFLTVCVGPLFYLTRRHAQNVQRATLAADAFARSVRRAQESLTSPLESDVVRRSEREAAEALAGFQKEEQRFKLLRLIQKREKEEAQQHFVEGIRQGYLRPALEQGVRQRQRDKILYGLAALYAANGSALGALVETQRTDFSQTLDVPVDLLSDYILNSPQAWRDKALLLLPPIPSESIHYPVTDLRPWQELVQSVSRAILQPSIAADQLDKLRKQAETLRETIERVRRATLMRRVYQMLAEETPLDMNKLFGGDVGALTPDPWIVDNLANLELLLRLIRDTGAQASRHGHMSLFELLRWINSLSSAGTATQGVAGGKALFAQDPTHFAFPSGKIYEVSERGWLDLLLRSRKRWLLSHQIQNVRSDGHSHHRRKCCGCDSSHKRRHRHCVPCEEGKRNRGSSSRSCRVAEPIESMPPFTHEELRPRIASLLSRGELPPADLGEEYNRAVFDHEVLPLVRELRKAVSESRALGAEDKIRLSQLVRGEIEGYASRYCKGLLRFYLSHHFHVGGSSVDGFHTALLELVRPGSRFISHLQTVAHNAALSGLDDPYLKPLSDCLAEFRPLVRVVSPELLRRDEGKAAPKRESSAPEHGGKTESRTGDAASAKSESASDGSNKDLEPYLLAVAKQAEELDAVWSPSQKPEGKPAESKPSDGRAQLEDHLGPLGRAALSMTKSGAVGGETPRQKAEQFLDKAGIVGALRRPFVEPFDAVYHQGEKEIEAALARHWKEETLPQISSLLSRFPFNQASEREVSPAELDVLGESGGAFFADIRSYYEPAIAQQGGVYVGRRGSMGAIDLPKDLLPTVNRTAKLARALFDSKGNRQPLRISIRGAQGRRASDGSPVQQALALLRVGKTVIYGFNQRTTAEPVAIEWWNQGVSLVGIESTSARSGRRHSQTLEVADSAWSLFRLLQKSTLESDGESTWRIHDEGAGEVQVIRFVITPDPWLLFRIAAP